MSNRKNENKVEQKVEKVVEPKAIIAPEPVAASEPKFFIYQLREYCREEFGVNPEVFDGALFDCKETQITKSEAEKRVNDFLTRDLNKEAKV